MTSTITQTRQTISFAEPDDFQVDSGNQGRREQGQDIKHDQRGVQEAEPDIIRHDDCTSGIVKYGKLQIKAPDNRDGDEAEMKGDHQPVHSLEFIFNQLS